MLNGSRECFTMSKFIQTIDNLKNWIVDEFIEIKQMEFNRKTSVWKIHCKNCDAIKISTRSHIKRDTVCKKCKNKPKGQSGLEALFNIYSKRNYMSLTLKEFKDITSSNCHYCGTNPDRLYKTNITNWGYYHWLGIDQKVPGQGYTTENSLPCCKTCNWAKGKMSYEKFIKWCDNLTSYRQLIAAENAIG
jgi:hypothetical protein